MVSLNQSHWHHRHHSLNLNSRNPSNDLHSSYICPSVLVRLQP
ncbi:MAG: hypothetical protein WA902_09505 [Thermosynechococcaceae cyanobacterium]